MMGLRKFFAQILREWGDLRGTTVRDTQLRRDTAHLFLLTSRRRDPEAFTRQFPENEVPLDDLPSFNDQAKFLKRDLTLGTITALRAVKASADAHPALTLPAKDPRAKDGEEQELRERLRSKLGFSLQIKPSSIKHPEAGNGLFLEGTVEAGRIVCFYPGIAYRPQHVRFMKNYPRIDKDNPYLLWRYDGVVLDGIGCKGNLPWELRNPLATGHFINHVPPMSRPNVLQCMMDYNLAKIPGELHSLIPNFTYSPGSKDKDIGNEEPRQSRVEKIIGPLVDFAVKERARSSSQLASEHAWDRKGLLFVALRRLQDEEIFFNYRFNASGPDWYVDPDPEQSKRRWGSSAFWE